MQASRSRLTGCVCVCVFFYCYFSYARWWECPKKNKATLAVPFSHHRLLLWMRSSNISFHFCSRGRADLEWKIIYVGSADSNAHDQVLESIMVGPIPVGVNKFVFQVQHHVNTYSCLLFRGSCLQETKKTKNSTSRLSYRIFHYH